MHGPLNDKSVSCLVTSGRNIILGKKKRERSSCFVSEKKYFHFMQNECSFLEYYSFYIGVLNKIRQFDYLRIGD